MTMEDTASATSTLLLDKLFSGGPESLIALLMMLVLGLVGLVYMLIQWNLEKEKQLQALNQQALDKLSDANKSVTQALMDVSEKHNENTQSTINALSNVQLVLTELRAYVMVLGRTLGD